MIYTNWSVCACFSQNSDLWHCIDLLQMSHNYSFKKGICIKTSNHSPSAIFKVDSNYAALFPDEELEYGWGNSFKNFSNYFGVSEILMMKLKELQKCRTWSRKAFKLTHQGPEQFQYSGLLKVRWDLNNLSHIEKTGKKTKEILAHLRRPSEQNW